MGPGKQTYSSPYTIDFDEIAGTQIDSGKAVVISASGREVTNLKLSGGGGAAFVSLHDAKDVASVRTGTRKWALDAGQAAPDNNVFPNPLNFKNGIVAVLEQGTGSNPILSVAVVGDLPA
jgi:hypothetical protein